MRLADDKYRYARLRQVETPGRVDAVVRLHGHVSVRHEHRVRDIARGITRKLVAADGTVVDESSFRAGARGWSPERHPNGLLATTAPGRYTVVVEIDGERTEHEVVVALGRTVQLDVPR